MLEEQMCFSACLNDSMEGRWRIWTGNIFFAAQKLKIHTCGCYGDKDRVIRRDYSENVSNYEIITPRDARARTHRHTRTLSHLHQTRLPIPPSESLTAADLTTKWRGNNSEEMDKDIRQSWARRSRAEGIGGALKAWLYVAIRSYQQVRDNIKGAAACELQT